MTHVYSTYMACVTRNTNLEGGIKSKKLAAGTGCATGAARARRELFTLNNTISLI